MPQRLLGNLTKIAGEVYGFDGYFYVQDLNTSSYAYKVLFTPLGSSASGCRDILEAELGCELVGLHLEMKFYLSEDATDGMIDFSTPKEMGFKPLSMASMTELGLGLALSIREIQAQIRPNGIAALVLDERPQLKDFYRRLYRKHAAILGEYGYKPQIYLGGQGCAVFEEGFAASVIERTQGAQGSGR